MKLIRLLSALLCAGMLCVPVSAEELTVSAEMRETAETTICTETAEIIEMTAVTAPLTDTETKNLPESQKDADNEMPSAPVIRIDNSHVYDHMKQSYAKGYEPITDGGYAVIVLPLCCENESKPESLRVSAMLDAGSSAFIVKNYEQTVPLTTQTADDGSEQEIYLAEFWLELSDERINGCYPVQMQVADFNTYTVYVNITDGIDPNAKEPEPPVTEPPEEPVILQPKILVQRISGGEINAGETAELHISLKNSSHIEMLQNLTVTASANAPLVLEAAADTLYFERIGADEVFETVFRCKSNAGTPAGIYDIPLQYDFAYGKGMTGTGSGTARVTVGQPVKMAFPQVIVPTEAVVSDCLSLHLQAMNLGASAVSNVRAELTANGLLPEETAFIGTVNGGTSADAVLNVQVSSKRGTEPYGETEGQIIFTYTDENGQDHTETQNFTLMLKSPFSERTSAPEQADSHAWMWIMAGIGSAILLLSAVLIFRRKRGAL